MLFPKIFLRTLLTILVISFSGNAFAQFEKSSGQVFIAWPSLKVEPTPARQTEIMIYAIIDGDVALYSIAVTNGFSIIDNLGTFQCNQEFTILKTSSFGFYDIKCVTKNYVGDARNYTLKYDNTSYQQGFIQDN